MTPHTYDGGVIVKAPTTEETGLCTYTCTVCGGTKDEILPMIVGNPTETTAGDAFDEVSARAGEKDFALFTVETNGDAKTDVPVEISAPDGFTVTHVYAIVGEYILPVDFTADGDRIGFTASKDTTYAFCDSPLLTYGDATGDGQLSLPDILRTLRVLCGEDVPIDKAAADISHSASLGLDDALLIVQALLRAN